MTTEDDVSLSLLSDALSDPDGVARFRLHGVLSSGHRLRGNQETLRSAIATSRLLVHGGIGPVYHRGQLLEANHPDRFRHIEVLDPAVAVPFIAAAYQIEGIPGGGQEDYFLSPSRLAKMDSDNPVVDSAGVFIL